MPLNFGGQKRSGVFDAVWPSAQKWEGGGAQHNIALMMMMMMAIIMLIMMIMVMMIMLMLCIGRRSFCTG